MKTAKKIITAFFVWRAGLFIAAFLAAYLLPNFGSRFPYWNTVLEPTGLPSWVWGFGNFDGVHYLRLVLLGYEGSQYSQAFFPLYPLLIKLLSFGSQYLLSALLLSNLLFLLGIYVFYKLLQIDYDSKTSFKSVLLLLAFPTAFYFGSVYSESLFFFLAVSSLFLLRKGKLLEAGFCGALASATRVLGLLLIPVFLIEIYLEYKKGKLKLISGQSFKAVLSTFFIPLGTFLYMWYLRAGFDNPLYFLTSQPAFGAERSSLPIVLLPQVVFRYVKMLVSVPINSWQFFSSALELTFTAILLAVLVFAFKKIRLSYWLFAAGCLLIPTLTGTLSSMPRYSLMAFFLLPAAVISTGKYFKPITAILIIMEVILASLFTRGYWVA